MKIIIKNVNIIDVKKENILKNVSILISDGKISKIGKNIKQNKIKKFYAMDLWAIPSYIDMHAHITFDGREDKDKICFKCDEDIKYSIARSAQNLLEALFSGICLIRDLGAKENKSTLIDELIKTKKILVPEVIFSGAPFCLENGHGSTFGQIIKRRNNINKLLYKHKLKKFKWLKIMNGPELFDITLLKKIINEAHSLDIKVAVHAFTKGGIEAAINANADTIEHAIIYDKRSMELAKEKNIVFIPTFFCAYRSLHKNYLKGISDIEKSYILEWFYFLKKYIRIHLKSGLNTLVGTDAGSAPCLFSDIIGEIKILHFFGLSIFKAIKAATYYSAKILDCEENFGSIDIGKWANFILLNRNPILDINALLDVNSIWFKGVEILNNRYKKSLWN